MNGSEIDPTRATSSHVTRGLFVGIAATAGVAASAIPALSSDAPLGEAHTPIVSPDDPAISAERIELTRPDAVVPAYAAWPRNAGAATPSVVVVMHVWGVDVSIRDVVRRFAKAGFAAVAPDLYARFGAPSGDGNSDIATFRPYAQQLTRPQYAGDLESAAGWLKTRFSSTRTGIVGFCMGGRLAMLATIDDRDVFAAVCPFYGPLTDVDPAEIRVPLCGSYGGRDSSIPPDSVRAFAAALRVPNDVRIYDSAGHAFFDDQRPAYVASAAGDAWKRTLDFLTSYTQAKAP